MRTDSRSIRCKVELGTVRLLACQADGRLDARQRRAQLVRHIVEQAPLPVDERFEPLRHAIKVAPQHRQLVAPRAQALTQSRRQVTLGQRPQRTLQ
ncbi:MAG: hypothetical protein QM776_07560 [Rhodocyclaceae bacterium]